MFFLENLAGFNVFYVNCRDLSLQVWFKSFQLVIDGEIQHINYLYNGMGELFYTATYSLEKRIQIACHYISFLMQDSEFQAEKINTFRAEPRSWWLQ